METTPNRPGDALREAAAMARKPEFRADAQRSAYPFDLIAEELHRAGRWLDMLAEAGLVALTCIDRLAAEARDDDAADYAAEVGGRLETTLRTLGVIIGGRDPLPPCGPVRGPAAWAGTDGEGGRSHR